MENNRILDCTGSANVPGLDGKQVSGTMGRGKIMIAFTDYCRNPVG